MTLLAIDPGRDTGWALFNSALMSCGVGDPRPLFMGRKYDVIIERPQVYPSNPVPPNDLITLAIQVGEYKQAFSHGKLSPQEQEIVRAAGQNPVRLILPREWKGQVPKGVHHARVHGKLTPQEQEVVRAAGQSISASKIHNMMDAVGLGLFALGRTRVGGT